MPWCPKCRTEYYPGYCTCSDCEEALVDALPIESKPVPVRVSWVLVKEAADDREGDIIISLLEADGIPVLRKYPGAGEFLRITYGMVTGVRIYVPEDCLEEAQDLLKQVSFNPDDWEVELPPGETLEGPREPFPVSYQGRRKIGLWLLVMIFILPTLIPVVVAFFKR